MKRLHVHVSVDDLAQSTRFYSTLAKLKEVSGAACCAPTCSEPEAILQSAPQPATAACCTR
jgi:hypothetical protein